MDRDRLLEDLRWLAEGNPRYAGTEEEGKQNPELAKLIAERIAAYGVLLIALLLTVLAWYYVRQNVEVHNRARFEESSQATQEVLERRSKAYLDAMFGARGLFYASNSVGPKEWSDYVEGIKPAGRFEGLQALGFAQRVDPENRGSFMREARSAGLPPMRPDLNPGGERSAYFPLIYTGPLGEANQSMLDYDFYAEGVHRKTMDLARDSGEPQATRMVYVLSEAPPTPGRTSPCDGDSWSTSRSTGRESRSGVSVNAGARSGGLSSDLS